MAIITLNTFSDNYTASEPGDEIRGVGGNDTLTASAGGNRLEGGEGDDVLNGGAGNDVLVGDDVTNFTAHNVMKGFGGDDSIVTLSWYDEVSAGSGNDTVASYAQITGQHIDGGSGTDQISINSLVNEDNPVHLTMGSIFTCIIGGINGATYLNFEVLRITLGLGANTITGGDGDDQILTAYKNGSNATDTFSAGFVRAGGGNDLVAFNGITAPGGGVQEMSGGSGTDRLAWTSGIAAIGDLAINSAKGSMIADGRKFATFSGFEDVAFRSFDHLDGALSYKGFGGTDSVQIGALSSAINTFGGNDSVEVAGGTAVVNGGQGDDFLRVSFPNASQCVLNGGDGNDLLIGGSGQSNLFGEDGDDGLTASNSRTNLYGGKGSDVLAFSQNNPVTGSGAATLDGGSGRDSLTLTMLALSGDLVFNLKAATITLADGTTIIGIEAHNFQSGFGHDDLTASNDAMGAAANKISGMSGNDTLRASSNGAALDGGFGLDLLIGAAADDLLTGGFGSENDILRGNGGNDILIGNFGADVLTGGLGADSFRLTAAFESGTTEATRDQIKDFSRTQGDKVDLALVDAVQAVLGDQAFTFIAKQAFHNVAGELRYELFNLAGTANDHTLISGDTNGDGTADFSIYMSGIFNLNAPDFIL